MGGNIQDEYERITEQLESSTDLLIGAGALIATGMLLILATLL